MITTERQLDRVDFFTRLRTAFADQNVPLSMVELEFTESAAMQCTESDLAEIAATMERLRATPPTTLGGLAVERAEDLAEGSALPPTDGLRYSLAEGARVIVRPSGTEPKVKCYLEVVVPVEPGTGGSGVDAARISAAGRLDAIKAEPSLGTFQFRVANRWIDGAHNRSTIKGFYGAGQEDTTREVAHETSGHGDTVVAAMPHNVARGAATEARRGALGSFAAWRCALPGIPSAWRSSRSD